MNKSQKTLMGKYYSVCCAIILLSMVLVGSIFMVLANDYLREEKISLLEKNVNQAARLTMENYAAHEYRYVSSDTLQPVYAVLGSAIEADIYLSDNKGNILIMAHTTEGTVPQSVPEAVLESLSKTGSYQGSVMMAGTGEDPQYAVATPVVDENGLLVGAVMAVALRGGPPPGPPTVPWPAICCKCSSLRPSSCWWSALSSSTSSPPAW